MVATRLRLVADLGPLLGKAYEAVARGATPRRRDDGLPVLVPDRRGRRPARPHRGAAGRARASGATTSSTAGSAWSGRTATTSCCRSGDLPVKGYASHGESWSFALALRLASYDLLRSTATTRSWCSTTCSPSSTPAAASSSPSLVAGAEQVLVTAAVADDVPDGAAGHPVHRRRRAGDPRCRDDDELTTSRDAGRRSDRARRRRAGPGPGDRPRPRRAHPQADPARRRRRGASSFQARRSEPDGSSGAHPDERDPQTIDTHPRAAGRRPGLGAPSCGCTACSRAGRRSSAATSPSTARPRRSPTAGSRCAPTRPPGRPS